MRLPLPLRPPWLSCRQLLPLPLCRRRRPQPPSAGGWAMDQRCLVRPPSSRSSRRWGQRRRMRKRRRRRLQRRQLCRLRSRIAGGSRRRRGLPSLRQRRLQQRQQRGLGQRCLRTMQRRLRRRLAVASPRPCRRREPLARRWQRAQRRIPAPPLPLARLLDQPPPPPLEAARGAARALGRLPAAAPRLRHCPAAPAPQLLPRAAPAAAPSAPAAALR
jgi:hypothetical protein